MASDAATVRVPSFGATLRSGASGADVAAILTVPAVLVVVFLLPVGFRESLVFRYGDPSLVDASFAPFVHLQLGHLLVNVAGYCLIVGVVYGLDVLGGNRLRFVVVFATILLAFPALLSVLNLAAARPAGAIGFSGVVMAFAGYLPIALADFAEARFDVPLSRSLAAVLFFVALAAMAVLSVASVVPENGVVLLGTAQLVLATLLAAVLFGLPLVEERKGLGAALRRAASVPGYFEFFGVATVLFLLVPVIAFPPDPVGPGATVNLYVHLVGFSLGFTVVYTTQYLTESFPVGPDEM